MNNNTYTKGLSVKGGLGSSFSFNSEKDRSYFILETLPKLIEEYGPLQTSLFDLPGLKIGDYCKVYGEGEELFQILGIKIYSNNRPGFILDSGWSEEVVKCYK